METNRTVEKVKNPKHYHSIHESYFSKNDIIIPISNHVKCNTFNLNILLKKFQSKFLAYQFSCRKSNCCVHLVEPFKPQIFIIPIIVPEEL